MRKAILFAFALILAAPASALATGTLDFLKSAAKAEIESDLPSVIERALPNHSGSGVWRDALQLMRDRRVDPVTRYASVARLMSAAVLLSGQPADDVPLDSLSQEDISAMVDAIGFPDKSDLIRYLLMRGPSMRYASPRGEYTAIRLAEDGRPRVLRERADQPILGLSPVFSTREFAPENDPVAKPDSERAKTRRAALASIPPMVISAKAYRNSGRAALADRPYAAIIALEALEDAVKADPHMRVEVYSGYVRAEKVLLETAKAGPLPMDLQREQSKLALELPSTAFVARLFDDAVRAYANVSLPDDDQQGRVSNLWGIAISRFAAREDATKDLQKLVAALDKTTARFARIALRFFEALPAKDAAAFPNMQAWRDKAKAAIGEPLTDAREQYRVDSDFVQIMETIARPDIAARFLMSRISETRGQSLESAYLYRLAPFVRDYCSLISFQISRHGTWERLSGAGYDPLLDFLNNIHPSGRLTRSGEIVRPSGGSVPYPALNPEEDCAVILAASGIAEGLLTPGLRPEMSAEFEDWVRQAFERETPPPSLAPYLKLLFVDWFASAFEKLKARSVPASDYRYMPLNSSPLASPALARELLGRATTPAAQRATLELFLQTRTFLEQNYSG